MKSFEEMEGDGRKVDVVEKEKGEDEGKDDLVGNGMEGEEGAIG